MVEHNERGELRAAGGLVWRPGPDGGLEVLVVHRPRYDDWSLPKGKVDPGETDEGCALREVEEETGLRCRLGEEVAAVRYRDRYGRLKAVRYWAMEPDGSRGDPSGADAGRAVSPEEVDEVRWVPASEAVSLLTYGRDREVVSAFARGRR